MAFFWTLLAALIMMTAPGAELLAEGLRPLNADESRLVKELNKPRRIVLAIGINEFADPFWNSLQFAASDASHVYQFLRQEAQIPFNAGELVIAGTTADGKVTRQSILGALERLKTLNRSEEDTVVIYLSTHGTIFLRKNQRMEEPSAYVPYFAASDTQHQDIQNTAISRDDLVNAFQSLKSQRKALIIASCHSGGGKAQITPEIREALKHLKGSADTNLIPVAGKGYSILAASSWSEPAVEDPQLKQDIYTHFLLDALRKNKDRAFTLTQAHDFATASTIAFTKNFQHPTIQMDQSGGDPIILSGEIESQHQAFLYSYLNSLKNFELRIGGQSKGIIGNSYMTIPEGKYRLEIVEPDSQKVVASRVIRLKSGKEYAVSDLIQARNRWHGAVGLGYGKFYGATVQKTFAAEPSRTTDLSLRLDEAFGIWDIVGRVSYSPWQTETISIDGQRFPQRRSFTRFFLGLGSREHTLVGEWGWYAGPGFLQLKRQIKGEASEAVTGAEAEVILPALGLGVNLDVPLSSGLEVGIQAQYDTFYNQGQLQDVEHAFYMGQIEAYLGVSW